MQIGIRFFENNLDILNAVYGFPKAVKSSPDWQAKFSKFLDMYKDDLPESRYLQTELEMWSVRCNLYETDKLPTTLVEILEFTNKTSYPNIYTAFQIFGTIPVTTCSCERSISALRRLKTYLRSSMSENRLKGLAMLHVHREIYLDTNKVIDRFATKHPRRMALKHVLLDE